MNFIRPDSLVLTIDTINEALFFKRPISRSDRVKAAKWITSRVDMPDSYESLPAPTKRDFKNGLRLFTGEKISTRAGIAHIIGQEACRVLALLDVDIPTVLKAREVAEKSIIHRIKSPENKRKNDGMYCCAACSCAMWRNIAAGGLRRCEPMLKTGIRTLKSRRDGKGRWKGFPFYYTILLLSEMVGSPSHTELVYAFNACQNAIRRLRGNDKFAVRRRHLLQMVIQRCT
jgi:hypothetical protein